MRTTVGIILLSLINILWWVALIILNNHWAKQANEICEMARRQNEEWYEFCQKQRQNFMNIINEYRGMYDEILQQISQQENDH